MMRREDWPMRLVEFVDERRATPFVWGASDCCAFAADAVLAMTDTDILARWRGTYASEKGALRILRDYDGLIGFTDTMLLPNKRIALPLAGRGDVVAVGTPTGNALALHIGTAIVGQGVHGAQFFPVTEARFAWKI